MKKYSQVVISPDVDFYLSAKDVIDLQEMGCSWAASTELHLPEDRFYPDQNQLPRHSKALIELSKIVDRFECINLEVRMWPPKYMVLPKKTVGEICIEPSGPEWKCVYYPEMYDMSDPRGFDEDIERRIRAIAP